jgi:hypothetical protein
LGWWSQLGRGTGGRRWRRCQLSTSAWPTGTTCTQTIERTRCSEADTCSWVTALANVQWLRWALGAHGKLIKAHSDATGLWLRNLGFIFFEFFLKVHICIGEIHGTKVIQWRVSSPPLIPGLQSPFHSVVLQNYSVYIRAYAECRHTRMHAHTGTVASLCTSLIPFFPPSNISWRLLPASTHRSVPCI